MNTVEFPRDRRIPGKPSGKILQRGWEASSFCPAIPHFFPRRKKWGKKDAPVKSRFPRRSARLRETQNSLRSNRLRFSFRKRLPARGFSTGKAHRPIHPPHFPLLRCKRGTEGEFRGEGTLSCITVVYVHTCRNFWGIASFRALPRAARGTARRESMNRGGNVRPFGTVPAPIPERRTRRGGGNSV